MIKNQEYEDIIFNSGLKALKLDIKIPYKIIYQELLQLNHLMVSQINNNKWQGATIRGLDSDKPRPYYEYGYKSDSEVPYKWTKESEICKITKKMIKEIFGNCSLYRIKVNVLHPNGKIHLHNDSNRSALGLSDKTSDSDSTFVSFAIHWPNEVIFNLADIRIPFKSGDVYLLDFSKNHEVYNPTKETRYYLLVTGKLHQSKKWQNLVIKSYKKFHTINFEKKVQF